MKYGVTLVVLVLIVLAGAFLYDVLSAPQVPLRSNGAASPSASLNP